MRLMAPFWGPVNELHVSISTWADPTPRTSVDEMAQSNSYTFRMAGARSKRRQLLIFRIPPR